MLTTRATSPPLRIGFALGVLALTLPASARAGYGFVWANQASTASYTPSQAYRWNSTGGTNTIQRDGTGRYAVFMPGLAAGAGGGNVQVTAYGSGAGFCKVASWYTTGGGVQVLVRCFDADGDLADRRFTAFFQKHEGAPAAGTAVTYLWANQQSADTYQPSATYAHNSSGAPMTITRGAPGRYSIEIPLAAGLVWQKGSAVVTAYGTDARRCDSDDTERWVEVGKVQLSVTCFDEAGEHTDSRFSLSFAQETSPILGREAATVNAVGEVAWTSDGGAPTLDHLGVGRYRVRLPDFTTQGKSSVIVSASSHHEPLSDGPSAVIPDIIGEGPHTCNVASWSRGSVASYVHVRCYDADNAPSDTRFDMHFLTSDVEFGVGGGLTGLGTAPPPRTPGLASRR